MKNIIRLGLAFALAGAGCANVLGDVTFDRETGGSGGTGGMDSTSSSSSSGSGSGDATSSSSSTSASSSSTSASSSTGGVLTCSDITCTAPATCNAKPDGAVCECPSGYHDVKGDGSSCVDWDECNGENGGNACTSLSTCKNTDGGYDCVCNPGAYEHPAGSKLCIDDPCIPNLCPAQNACTNDTGSAVCTCVAFVDPSATGTGDGTSWKNAFTSIQPAILAASAAVKGGQASCDVWVKEGTYYLYSATDPDNGIALRTSVGVYGGFAGTEKLRAEADPKAHKTILSGKDGPSGANRANHVVAVYDQQNAVIDGFTIQDGDATDGSTPEEHLGGGVMAYVFNAPAALGGSLTISHCEITGNKAFDGGGVGMAPHDGVPLTVTVTDCDIHDNSATFGAGGMHCAGGSCTIQRTTFRSNVANTEGGGLYAQSPVTGDTITFSNNVAVQSGGGAMFRDGSPGSVLTNLIFDGNHAGTSNFGGGAGIALATGGIAMSNAVFVGNSADYGGAIHDDSPSGLSCLNCTITGNRALVSGDGVRWINAAPALTNTIAWGNPNVATPSAGKDLEAGSANGAVLSFSDVHGFAGGTVIDADPQFTKLPVFFDRVASLTASTTSVAVTSGSLYAMGDVIEIGGDGVARTVGQVSGNTVPFTPALGAPAGADTSIRNWGSALGTLDLHLGAASPCGNTADGTKAPSTDITGKSRMGAPDMGAYESL